VFPWGHQRFHLCARIRGHATVLSERGKRCSDGYRADRGSLLRTVGVSPRVRALVPVYV